MSLARLVHAVTNRVGRIAARVISPAPEQFNGEAQAQFREVALVANRWEYGSRFGLPGYEYRRFLPSLRKLVENVLFVPIEMRNGIIDSLKSTRSGSAIVPVISVFQNQADIPDQYFLLKEAGCTLINWYTDDDMQFSNFGSRVANSFDLNVTTFAPNVPLFKSLGAEVAESQWAGFENVAFLSKKQYLAAFIGRMYGQRAELATRLRKRYGARVFVNDTRLSSISEHRMIRIYQESLLAIDEPTAYDGKSLQIKARIFENASTGSAVLTKYNTRLDRYFRQDREILFYQDYDALFRILDDAAANPDRYLQIARAAYDRVHLEHTYADRFRILLKTVTEKPRR